MRNHKLTDKEHQELERRQRQDILDRYDNENYWNPMIQEEYLQELDEACVRSIDSGETPTDMGKILAGREPTADELEAMGICPHCESKLRDCGDWWQCLNRDCIVDTTPK